MSPARLNCTPGHKKVVLEESKDPEIIKYTYHHNSEAWKGKLSRKNYIDRELYLREESRMLNNEIESPLGIHLYVLRDYSLPASSKFDNIVAALEVLIRKAWRINGATNECQVVNCATVGNVFTLNQHRKKGYASELVSQLNVILDHKLEKGGFSILYSEVGSFYSKFGFEDQHVEINVIPSISVIQGKLPDFEFLNLKGYDDLIDLHVEEVQSKLIFQNAMMGPTDIAVSLIPNVDIYHQMNLKDLFIHSRYMLNASKRVENFGAKLRDSNHHVLWNHDWNSNSLVITKIFFDRYKEDDFKSIFFQLLFVAGLEAQNHDLKEIIIWNSSLSYENPILHSEIISQLKKFSIKSKLCQVNPSLCAIRINDFHQQNEIENVHWIENEKWCWY